MIQAAVLLLVLTPVPAVKAVVDPPAEAFVRDKPNAGLVVGVLRDGRSMVVGYGTVRLRTGDKRPAADTLFAVGSITKAFTGVLLADAVKRGEVKLDAPANDYLPADLRLKQAGDRPITLEDLATHTSGLPVQPPMIGLFARDAMNPYADFDRPKLAAMLRKMAPDPPSSEPVYSNLGAGIVGHALVHAAKADSFDALVKERVGRPLGLVDTAEALTGDQLARLAGGHTDKGKPAPHWDFATLSACGGLKSTATDLLRFAAAGWDGGPLAETIRTSQTRVRAEHGLFWVIQQKTGRPVWVWHNGGTTATRAMLLTVPSERTAVVVLCGWADEGTDDLAVRVLQAILPAGR